MLIVNSVVIPKEIEDAGPASIESYLKKPENAKKVREHVAANIAILAPVRKDAVPAPLAEPTPELAEPTELAEED